MSTRPPGKTTSSPGRTGASCESTRLPRLAHGIANFVAVPAPRKAAAVRGALVDPPDRPDRRLHTPISRARSARSGFPLSFSAKRDAWARQRTVLSDKFLEIFAEGGEPETQIKLSTCRKARHALRVRLRPATPGAGAGDQSRARNPCRRLLSGCTPARRAQAGRSKAADREKYDIEVSVHRSARLCVTLHACLQPIDCNRASRRHVGGGGRGNCLFTLQERYIDDHVEEQT